MTNFIYYHIFRKCLPTFTFQPMSWLGRKGAERKKHRPGQKLGTTFSPSFRNESPVPCRYRARSRRDQMLMVFVFSPLAPKPGITMKLKVFLKSEGGQGKIDLLSFTFQEGKKLVVPGPGARARSPKTMRRLCLFDRAGRLASPTCLLPSRRRRKLLEARVFPADTFWAPCSCTRAT